MVQDMSIGGGLLRAAVRDLGRGIAARRPPETMSGLAPSRPALDIAVAAIALVDAGARRAAVHDHPLGLAHRKGDCERRPSEDHPGHLHARRNGARWLCDVPASMGSAVDALLVRCRGVAVKPAGCHAGRSMPSRQRVAAITNARIRPSMAPVPNRAAKASAALCVASSSLEASRASISLRSGLPWQ